jgi:signal transduction histidine kinase
LPGSGLGLSIVSQIAVLHGGTVVLDAREGGGTVARLTLPTV